MTRMEVKKIGITHYFSVESAKKDLGYEPIVSMKEGLKRTSQYFKKELNRQEGKNKIKKK